MSDSADKPALRRLSDLSNPETLPYPGAGKVVLRSIAAGLLSGASMGAMLALLTEPSIDWLMLAAIVAATLGTAVGLILGVLMAIWLGASTPKRSSVRRVVTAASIIGSYILLMAIFRVGYLQYLLLPFIGIATWVGVPMVLKTPEVAGRHD